MKRLSLIIIALIAFAQTTRAQSQFAGGNGDPNNPYLIDNVSQWNFFCDALQDNNTWNRFSGKCVKLGANITVTRMAGSSGHDFMGIFDGGSDTLTFNYGSSSRRIILLASPAS